MMGVFYAVVIYILYATLQTKNPDFDEYAVGGRRYGPIFIGMSYVQSWFPGRDVHRVLRAQRWLWRVRILLPRVLLCSASACMYFMANRAWRWGQRYDLRSQPDLLGMRYNSDARKEDRQRDRRRVAPAVGDPRHAGIGRALPRRHERRWS